MPLHANLKRHPLPEDEPELPSNLGPVLLGFHLLSCLDPRQIKHLDQSLVGWELALAVGDFPKLAMHIFDGVRRVDHATNGLRKLEEGRKALPVVPPRGDDDRVLLAPLGFELVEFGLRDFEARRPVHGFQISEELLLVFRPDVLEAVSDLMDDTKLREGLRVGGFDVSASRSRFVRES